MDDTSTETHGTAHFQQHSFALLPELLRVLPCRAAAFRKGNPGLPSELSPEPAVGCSPGRNPPSAGSESETQHRRGPTTRSGVSRLRVGMRQRYKSRRLPRSRIAPRAAPPGATRRSWESLEVPQAKRVPRRCGTEEQSHFSHGIGAGRCSLERRHPQRRAARKRTEPSSPSLGRHSVPWGGRNAARRSPEGSE